MVTSKKEEDSIESDRVESIAAAINAAVLAERERCAKMLDELAALSPSKYSGVAGEFEYIALKIREGA